MTIKPITDLALGLWLQQWHESGGCPIYQLGSFLPSGEEQTMSVYEQVIVKLNRDLIDWRELFGDDETAAELTDLIAAVKRRKDQSMIRFDPEILKYMREKGVLCERVERVYDSLVAKPRSVRSSVQLYLGWHESISYTHWQDIVWAAALITTDRSWIEKCVLELPLDYKEDVDVQNADSWESLLDANDSDWGGYPLSPDRRELYDQVRNSALNFIADGDTNDAHDVVTDVAWFFRGLDEDTRDRAITNMLDHAITAVEEEVSRA